MLVFAAEFPAAEGRSVEDVLDVAREWLVGSQHYPWNNPNELPHTPGEVVDFEKEGQRVSLSTVRVGDRTFGGIRHLWDDNDDIEWSTEIVGTLDDAGLWVSVTVSCNALRPTANAPEAKKPYIIKLLISRLGGGPDGRFNVSDKPHILDTGDLDTAAGIIECSLGCHLPIVYVSAGFDGRPTIDFVRLARDLSGAAHVVVEPDRRFSFQLADKTGGRNVYGGALGLHWPDGSGRSQRFLPRDYDDEQDLVGAVGGRLRESWLYAKAERGASWSELVENVSRHRLDALRSAGSTKVDEFVVAFDRENAALRKQLHDAQSKLNAVQASLGGASRARRGVADGFLAAGNERDLYEGEIVDTTLEALREALDRTTPGSRRSIVLRDILAANHLIGGAAQLEEGIRRALENAMKITRREIALLEQIGFVVEDGGKHYRATFGGDPRLVFTLHKTASDYRSPKNLVSQIVKALLK